MPRSLSLGLLLTLATLQAQATTTPTTQAVGTRHPFLWRIDGNGDKTFKIKSWLYGTMHSGDERLVKLPDAVEQARRSADALYFEVKMETSQEELRQRIDLMRLPSDQLLRDRLPRKLFLRLSAYLADRNVDIRTIGRARVWVVAHWVDRVNSRKEKMTHGLDRLLYRDAKAAGKEVGGLETIAEQLGAVANRPEQDRIKVLRASLTYLEKLDAKGVAPTRMLLDAYLTGDEAKIMAKIHAAFGKGTDILERFLQPSNERNVRMADRMAKMMEEHPKKSYFFAVGVLHCPYEKGIVDLLRKKGYRITRIGAPKKKLRRRWL